MLGTHETDVSKARVEQTQVTGRKDPTRSIYERAVRRANAHGAPGGTSKSTQVRKRAAGRVRGHDLVEFRREMRAEMGIADMFKRAGGMRSTSGVKHKGKRMSRILEDHARFLQGQDNGVRADLSGADLHKMNLSGANLNYANLAGARMDGTSLKEAKLSFADMSKANLREADMRRADLTETNLSEANLTGAQLNGVELFRANLHKAVLRRTDLTAANFRNADVSGADFHGATMTTTVLRETNLEGIDLRGLDLSTTLMPRNWKQEAEPKA